MVFKPLSDVNGACISEVMSTTVVIQTELLSKTEMAPLSHVLVLEMSLLIG